MTELRRLVSVSRSSSATNQILSSSSSVNVVLIAQKKSTEQKTTSTNHSQNDDTTEQRKDHVHVFARLAWNKRSDFQLSNVFFLFLFFLAKFISPAAHFPPPNLSLTGWRQRRSIIAGAGGQPATPEGQAGGRDNSETQRRLWFGCCRARRRIRFCCRNSGGRRTFRFPSRWCHHLGGSGRDWCRWWEPEVWQPKKVKEAGLTCILEVHVVAFQGVPQPVAHDFELHDLLSDSHVWLGDVELNLWVVDLIGQTVSHHLWKIPGEIRGRRRWLGNSTL